MVQCNNKGYFMLKYFIYLLLFVTLSFAAKPAKTVKIDLCNNKLCYIAIIDKVTTFTNITDDARSRLYSFYTV
jgi:hypothetical protein